MAEFKIDTNVLIILAVVIIILLFLSGNRREGMYAVGLDDIHPSGPGLFMDSQGKTCPSHMLQPTLTGSQWPYQPKWYCRNWTGTIDTNPPVINGCPELSHRD